MIFLIMLIFITPIYAKDLDIDTYIKLAQDNDLEFELLKTNRKKLDYLVDLGLPTRELLISARGEYGTSSGTSSNTQNISMGVTKEILESGTSVSLTKNEAQRPDRQEEVLQFRIEQSIYKNFFGSDIRFKKELLNLQVDKVKLEIKELYESYLVDLSVQYYDFAAAYFNLELAKTLYSETQKFYKDLKARHAKKIASSTDISRATLQLIVAKEEVIKRQKNLEVQRLTMEKVIGQKIDNLKPKLDEFEKIELDRKIDINNLRTFKIAKLEEEIIIGNESVIDREGKADLNVILGYNKDQSTRFGTKVDRDEKIVGLELDLPIGDSVNSAQKMQAAMNAGKARLNLRLTQRNLDRDLENLKKELINSYELLQLSIEKTKLSTNILNDDLKRYSFGKIDLDLLIVQRKDNSEFRFENYSRTVQYNLLRLRWLALTDNLLKGPLAK